QARDRPGPGDQGRDAQRPLHAARGAAAVDEALLPGLAQAVLLAAAPVRGAAADRRARHVRAAARADAVAGAVGDDRAGVDAAALDRAAGRGADLAAQAVQLGVVQRLRRAARVELRAPERLVGQEVADAGDHRLIHDPSLERCLAVADALAEGVPADLGG